MATVDVPPEVVAYTLNRLLSAILDELGKYATAVSCGNEELRVNINAAHQACVSAAVFSISGPAEKERLN